MLMRARNGRIGGSLRYPPSSTPPMARSFPAPPWRNSSVNGRKQEEFVKPANQCDSTKLPACCKVMQADVLPEEEDRVINRITKHGNLPNHQNNQIQQPRIISQSSSIATTSLSPKRAPLLSTQINQQQFINRPPPPPYPGQNVSKNSGGQTNNKVYGNFRVNGIGQTNNLNKNNPNKVTYPPNIHSNDDINNLIPCDTSTPKSVADSPNSSIKKFHYQQPPTQNNNIPSEFSRANNVNGLKKGEKFATYYLAFLIFKSLTIKFSLDLSPSTPQPSRNELRLDTKKPLIVPAQTFNKDSQKITENLNIERPERVPSIYENVSKNGENTEINVKEIKEDKNNKTIEKPSSDVGERRGEKGAIWYELGCV
uniref:Uncharacterized protein n=1 Tax=Meloidogyne hapla TaxID=6305 RepID=A0A1I8BWQ9_MELHA